MQSLLLNAQIFGASNNLRKSLLSNSVGYKLADDNVSNNTVTLNPGDRKTFPAASASPSILYLVTTAPIIVTLTDSNDVERVFVTKKILITDSPFAQITVELDSNSTTSSIIHIVQG